MAEEKTDFDYKPDVPKAAKKNSGQTISWTASEYIDHDRGGSWYFLLVVGTLVLATIIYLLTKDKIATAITVILGPIVGSVAHWKPKQVDYELSADGLQADQKFYPFSQFKTFSIVHEGQLSSLVLNPIKRLMPPVSVFFDGNDEAAVISIIGEHLPMEERQPERIDRLSRRLRF